LFTKEVLHEVKMVEVCKKLFDKEAVDLIVLACLNANT